MRTAHREGRPSAAWAPRARAGLALAVLAWAALESSPVIGAGRASSAALCCALGVAAPAAALEPAKTIGQYSHVVWQEQNGLPSDMVSAVRQTRDGYMWFGTLNGLARFDGVSFTSFGAPRADAPLLHRITSLYEARDGGLWVGARGGLTCYRDGRFQSFPMPEGFRPTGVRTILEDARGRLWARTLSDLFLLRDGRLEHVAAGVRSLDLRGGTAWVTTQDGIGWLEGERIVPVRPAPKVPGEPSPFSNLSAVVMEEDGTVWLGAPWGLGRLRPDGEWTLFTLAEGLPSTAVTALCLDGEGTLWVGTTGGLVRVRNGRPVAEGRHPLVGQRIGTIYEDREGSVWVGTDTDGVHQLRNGIFTPVTTLDHLSDDLVMPIDQTRDGSIWIGTARGLNRLRDGRITTYGTADGLPDEGVFALAEAADGRLWIGTRRGPLTYLEGATLHAFSAPGLPASLGRVVALATTRDGALWVGTDVDGLFRVAGGTTTHFTADNGLSDNHVARIFQRADGSVWIATDRGITVWTDGRLTVYGTRDGLPSPQVRAFAEAGDSLWIGTYGGGLCRFRAGRFQALPPTAGLPDRVIYEILEDGRGAFWMTSNRGIIRAERAALERSADGAEEAVAFALYDIADGLKSSTCVGNFQPAGWRTRDGRLWFPTRRGAVWVDPARPLPSREPPRALIERVLLDGQPAPTAGLAVARPGRGDMTVEYTAPSFRRPDGIRFRYRLDGLDTDWQDAGTRRTAHYTNVPPGRYTFRVAAVSADGRPAADDARLDVELQPHFHQTSFFFALTLLAAAGAVWGAYRMKLRQVRSRFGAVLAERGRIAREMHDGLDQGFTAISLQLDLCARLAETGTAPKGALRQRLDLAKDLLEYARAEVRRSVSDLRSEALEAGDLVTALGRVAAQFSSGSELKVDVAVEGRARRLPGAVENNLLRICQEAVTNAVRHGRAHEVDIGLSFEREAVCLSVKDHGCGFDPATVASEREGHFGLMGIRERVKKLGGRLRLESEPGRGTAVLVEIPVSP